MKMREIPRQSLGNSKGAKKNFKSWKRGVFFWALLVIPLYSYAGKLHNLDLSMTSDSPNPGCSSQPGSVAGAPVVLRQRCDFQSLVHILNQSSSLQSPKAESGRSTYDDNRTLESTNPESTNTPVGQFKEFTQNEVPTLFEGINLQVYSTTDRRTGASRLEGAGIQVEFTKLDLKSSTQK